MKKWQYLAVVLVLLAVLPLPAQKAFDNWLKKKEGFKIQPFVMVQLWSSYTMDQKVYDKDLKGYEPVDNRLNFLLRRARLGFRMEPYENFKFTMVGAYDMIGRDVNTAITGSTNNASIPFFGIWDAYLEWRIKKGSEAFNLTAGYFRPQLSRESITSGWSVNSMEKAMSQNYIRTHLVGYGPGRALGVNLGGLFLRDDHKLGLNYNVGIFNPLYNGNTLGPKFSPLVVGRVVGYFGDPEMKEYQLGYDINYYNQRKGLSLGVGGAVQGDNNRFRNSYAASVDMLFNWGPLNLDGEWNFMWRDGQRPTDDNGARAFTYASNTGHFRAGYNLVVGNRFFLEPSFMVMQFNGALDATGQADAEAVGAPSGQDYTYDLGINWYLNKKALKLMLHYTWNAGDAGDAGAGFTGNMNFSQPGLGAIQRGNWLGLGLNAIF